MKITPYQKAMLDRIKKSESGFFVASPDKSSPFTRTLNSLLAWHLIFQDGSCFFISQAGERELEKLNEPASNIVPPRTHNYMNEKYTPEKNVYYRNEGNKHITSRGF